MTSAPAVIDQFRGRWAFLSNFHPAPFVLGSIEYPTSEHAFNALKTTDIDARLSIATASTPREAKRLGRMVRLRPNWDERVRFDAMKAVLRAKFTCHPGRVEALLSTGDALLIEGNTWHDQTWGDCRCGGAACAEPGANHLGRLLMELRTELRASASENR